MHPDAAAQSIEIETADGARLAARRYGRADVAEVAILINGATGVPQRFYAAFAEWLAATERAVVLTYDYRDFAESAPAGQGLRRSSASMADWGARDGAAALAALAAAAPGRPLWVIGHSLGGLCLPFQPGAGRVQRLIAVGSGPAHWSAHPLRMWPAILAFWWLAGPLATWALGYLPGRRLGLGADLPAGVYWQWRRWCLSRRFHRADWGRSLPMPDPEAMQGRIELVAISDDAFVPPARVRALAAHYPAADVVHRTIRPSDIGARAIGHLAAFAPRNALAWPMIMARDALS